MVSYLPVWSGCCCLWMSILLNTKTPIRKWSLWRAAVSLSTNRWRWASYILECPSFGFPGRDSYSGYGFSFSWYYVFQPLPLSRGLQNARSSGMATHTTYQPSRGPIIQWRWCRRGPMTWSYHILLHPEAAERVRICLLKAQLKHWIRGNTLQGCGVNIHIQGRHWIRYLFMCFTPNRKNTQVWEPWERWKERAHFHTLFSNERMKNISKWRQILLPIPATLDSEWLEVMIPKGGAFLPGNTVTVP